MRPVRVRVTGNPGCGKSHFALTFPDPITVFDYDEGLDDLLDKDVFKDKEIEVIDCSLPIQWSTKKKTFGKKEWEFFIEQYEIALEVSKTVVIDTGTTFGEIVIAAVAETLGVKQLMPYQYGDRNAYIKAVVNMAKKAEVNLVFTQHMKDVYVNEQRTGEKEPDGWGRLGGLVDWDIFMEVRRAKDGTVATKSYINKCRLERSIIGETYEDIDYASLVDLVEV